MKNLLRAAADVLMQRASAAPAGFLPSSTMAPIVTHRVPPYMQHLSTAAFPVFVKGDAFMALGISDGAEVWIDPQAAASVDMLAMAETDQGKVIVRRDQLPVGAVVRGDVVLVLNCREPAPAA